MSGPTRRHWGRKTDLPDRWLDYSNIGNVIPGTRFVCMKVPLKQELCRRLSQDQWFTPTQMVTELAEKGAKIGLLIDLTNTYRYYNPKEVEDQGISYAKIMVKGHEVPEWNEVKRFCDAVDRFENEHGMQGGIRVIGVHCTHGVNRTGYLVCRYLIDRKGWSVEKAINEFNLARGHNIERENYLDALSGPITAPYEESHFRPYNGHASSAEHDYTDGSLRSYGYQSSWAANNSRDWTRWQDRDSRYSGSTYGDTRDRPYYSAQDRWRDERGYSHGSYWRNNSSRPRMPYDSHMSYCRTNSSRPRMPYDRNMSY